MNKDLTSGAVELLKQLISTMSFSREEENTADILYDYLTGQGCTVERSRYNLITRNKHFDPARKTILLNSHHDTVKPNSKWTTDPFVPTLDGDKLTGLGSNDAGGPLVSLIHVFLHYYEKDINYNLILAPTAEEEISGQNGIASILKDLPPIDFAIVGEPTMMDLAIAEKGLMVLECTSHGKAGHAARTEGENSIKNALPDLEWFFSYHFDKVSETLGPVKMTPTIINSGSAHNVVPELCHFTVDVRTTDVYTNEEILEIIQKNVSCDVDSRSLRLQPSKISLDHPFVQAAQNAGCKLYGSPTLSDQALMSYESCKIGPGDSARSHTADEYILISEIEAGIARYIEILDQLLLK